MAIYFLRHGESVANVQNVFAGQKNNAPLTDGGLFQAERVGKEINGLGIDLIIASNLTRAIQTAEAVAKEIDYEVNNIIIDRRIAEYDTGVLTSRPIIQISSADFIKVDGAENVDLFYARIASFLRQYKDYGGSVLMVSHGGVERLIRTVSSGIAPGKFYDTPGCPNVYLTKLNLDWLK